MATLRENFHLIGLGRTPFVDALGQAEFDEFCPLSGGPLEVARTARVVAELNRPVAVYYPSIGMQSYTLYTMNLRLAPVQFMALGHPATTHCDQIDHVLVEEDYVGDPACFSEDVLQLPRDAMPYIPPDAGRMEPERGIGQAGALKIGVPAFLMKLNPAFLETCQEIIEKAGQAVEIHFFTGGSVGLVHLYTEKTVHAFVPSAIVHAHQPVDRYLRKLAACEIFVNPFPFGNTNGIVDTFNLAMPGVCMTGPEVHTHIDEGLFRRMDMPDWTIAKDREAYVSAALRLIREPDTRASVSALLTQEKLDRNVFQGRPEQFREVMESVLKSKGYLNIDERQAQ